MILKILLFIFIPEFCSDKRKKKMPVVQKCCFCISLPTGGITLGSLGIISGILSIISTIFGLVNLDKTFRAASEKLNLDITHDEYENLKTCKSFSHYFFSISSSNLAFLF
jgi:hypothetical protein